jgi:hypothetical protein
MFLKIGSFCVRSAMIFSAMCLVRQVSFSNVWLDQSSSESHASQSTYNGPPRPLTPGPGPRNESPVPSEDDRAVCVDMAVFSDNRHAAHVRYPFEAKHSTPCRNEPFFH